MAIKCSLCPFEAKTSSGLRLHMVKHKDRPKEVEPEVIKEEPLKHARIELLREDNSLIISYPVHGEKAIEEAKEHAKRNNFKIVIKPIS